eukprot:6061_1
MGLQICRPKGDETQEEEQNTQLNRILEEERINAALDFKILLLGAGESGKSTVVKQLRNVHLGRSAMSEAEIQSYIAVLHTNTINSMKVLIKATNVLEIPVEDEELKSLCEDFQQMEDNQPLTGEDADKVAKLWESQPMQEMFSRKNEVYFPDAAPYYFKHIHRFVESGFEPTEDDIVMARIRTTGMFTTAFDAPPVHWRVVDVGGQRSERKKWIRFFDDVEAILFVVNLAGYNQVLFEDQTKNRMSEALELFEKVTTTHCFKDTPIFLFLNKKDLFEEALRKSDITTCFPDYDGPMTTQDQLDHISSEFQKRMPGEKELSSVHFIAARVKRDVRYAFDDVKSFLLNHNEKRIGRLRSSKRRRLKNRHLRLNLNRAGEHS